MILENRVNEEKSSKAEKLKEIALCYVRTNMFYPKLETTIHDTNTEIYGVGAGFRVEEIKVAPYKIREPKYMGYTIMLNAILFGSFGYYLAPSSEYTGIAAFLGALSSFVYDGFVVTIGFAVNDIVDYLRERKDKDLI